MACARWWVVVCPWLWHVCFLSHQQLLKYANLHWALSPHYSQLSHTLVTVPTPSWRGHREHWHQIHDWPQFMLTTEDKRNMDSWWFNQPNLRQRNMWLLNLVRHVIVNLSNSLLRLRITTLGSLCFWMPLGNLNRIRAKTSIKGDTIQKKICWKTVMKQTTHLCPNSTILILVW